MILSFAQMGLSKAPLDSLRTEKIKGKKYVIHKVEPKETLYSIARRYGVSVDQLLEQNLQLKDGLKMYDEIQIPFVKKKKRQESADKKLAKGNGHIVRPGETLFAISRQYSISVDSLKTLNGLIGTSLNVGDTLRTASVKAIQATNDDRTLANANDKFHVVKASETLFGISRLYQVDIEDLQRWNQLPDYALSIGQKLLVSGEMLVEAAPNDTLSDQPITKRAIDSIQTKQPEIQALDTLYVRTDNSQFKTKIKAVEGKKQTVEEGFAMKIEDTDYTKKHLALHRTAPLGSTVMVKNQMTEQIIEARVVGKLPENALNKKLLMRLSSAAYQALGARDLKTPVTVSYLEDE